MTTFLALRCCQVEGLYGTGKITESHHPIPTVRYQHTTHLVIHFGRYPFLGAAAPMLLGAPSQTSVALFLAAGVLFLLLFGGRGGQQGVVAALPHVGYEGTTHTY